MGQFYCIACRHLRVPEFPLSGGVFFVISPAHQAIASSHLPKSRTSTNDQSHAPKVFLRVLKRCSPGCTLQLPLRPRLHKRRLQKASDDPHTQQDAEMAVGLTTQR